MLKFDRRQINTCTTMYIYIYKINFRSLNDEEASSDQLMGILKYLRKEKELISNQVSKCFRSGWIILLQN